MGWEIRIFAITGNRVLAIKGTVRVLAVNVYKASITFNGFATILYYLYWGLNTGEQNYCQRTFDRNSFPRVNGSWQLENIYVFLKTTG